MSAAKNHQPQTEQSHDERRTNADSQSRDRRVIPRLGHPELRNYMRALGRLCTVSVICCVAYICALIAKHIRDTSLELNRSIFFGVVLAVLAGGIAYLGAAVKSYVQNESQQRMIAVSERLYRAFFLFFVTGVMLAIVNVITWF